MAWATPPGTGTHGEGRQSDLVVMNADGRGLRPLSRTGALEATPVGRPTAAGSRSRATATCAAARASATEHFELYVMHADGTHVRRLTRNRVPDLYPSWQAVR